LKAASPHRKAGVRIHEPTSLFARRMAGEANARKAAGLSLIAEFVAAAHQLPR
jgi:hypothetical protein